MKKALFIVAQEGFQDHEYEIPRNAFINAGIDIKTVSKNKGKAIGKFGSQIDIDLSLSEVNVNDYDVILFVGGPGAPVYQNDEEAHQIAKEALLNNKLLTAICIAPTILAKAGLLTNKKATVWNQDNQQSDFIESYGAIYIDENVVIDGNIITANGPSAAEEFAKVIINKLGV